MMIQYFAKLNPHFTCVDCGPLTFRMCSICTAFKGHKFLGCVTCKSSDLKMRNPIFTLWYVVIFYDKHSSLLHKL